MIDVTEMLMDWHVGRSKNELAGRLGVNQPGSRLCACTRLAARPVPGPSDATVLALPTSLT